MFYQYKDSIGIVCIIIGLIMIVSVVSQLFFKVALALVAFSLINYGLRLRGLPPLQILLPLILGRNRFF